MDTNDIPTSPLASLPTDAKSAVESTNAKNKKTVKTNEEKNAVGQQDFLRLLITQLQNQDPLNPMDSQQFAVQLAEFSQVEQLISLNKKFDSGNSATGSVGNLAGFLGREVTLVEGEISIEQGKGPNLAVNIPSGAQSMRVDFYDKDDKKVGTEQYSGTLTPGLQKFALDGVTVPDGEYTPKVTVVTAAGGFQELKTRATGTVEGFVLQPTPALLVNGVSVALEKVEEVTG